MISVVINCDTRAGFDLAESNADKMFDGCKSVDFLIDGVLNKQKFFEGFDTETILYIDEHQKIPDEIVAKCRGISDCLVIRKHTNENSFNDYNYIRALQMASGDIVVHFDQDTAAFTRDKEQIQNLITLLNGFNFVSYPSYWSPKAVDDPTFGNRTWASTRFFMCRKEVLNFDLLKKCIHDPEWAYQWYGDSPRRCNWLEHFLSLVNNDSVFYPPMNIDQLAIFSWGSYRQGVLKDLNNMNYDQVKEFIYSHNGIVYPNDIHI